jgi:RsiW-degrading membrane proteinase PrsW (M82 family)
MYYLGLIALFLPLAIAPGLAIAFMVYFKDKFEKEPFKLIRNCFLYGMLCIIPAIIIELFFSALGINENANIYITAVYAFLVVGLTEELCKYIFLRYYAFRKADFNEPFDGIVYSVMISMGFATLENVLYAFSGGVSTILLRMITAVPLHATAAIFMGYYVGRAKFSKKRGLLLFSGLFTAVLIHGIYDFFLFQHEIPALAIFSFIFLGVGLFISFRAMKKSVILSPFRND